MKAVRLTGKGDVDVLEYFEEEDPLPGDGEVLIEVAAAGVNFMDVGFRRGMQSSIYNPTILGVEGAGMIVELGKGVSDFQVGDRVAWVFVPASYAQKVVAPVSALVKLPHDIDVRTAAAVMMQGLTASHFATEFYPVQSSDVALVHAGAGGVGLILTQIIKMRGGTVISRVSSEAKAEVARAAGADHIIVDRGNNFSDEAKRLSGGEGVHVVYDGSGPATFQGSVDTLRRNGTFCWYGPVLGAPEPFDILKMPKSIKFGYAVFSDHIPTPELMGARATRLFDWIRDGSLRITIGQVYPLEDVQRAHREIESRSSTGKLLLIP